MPTLNPLRQNDLTVKREAGNFDNYEQVSDNPPRWNCKTCKGTIMAVTVLHPVWDGPFPCSGSGQVKRGDDLPYCPKCEVEPSSSGAPIKVR